MTFGRQMNSTVVCCGGTASTKTWEAGVAYAKSEIRVSYILGCHCNPPSPKQVLVRKGSEQFRRLNANCILHRYLQWNVWPHLRITVAFWWALQVCLLPLCTIRYFGGSSDDFLKIAAAAVVKTPGSPSVAFCSWEAHLSMRFSGY